MRCMLYRIVRNITYEEPTKRTNQSQLLGGVALFQFSQPINGLFQVSLEFISLTLGQSYLGDSIPFLCPFLKWRRIKSLVMALQV